MSAPTAMYRISLEQFEGPLDLLLFFIKRDEIDIYDIPIARIADEFLAYVRLMDRIDLDGVGEFIYMASLLITIKARMLLPEPETDEEGEPVDPRRELVERLLEYVRFKEASQQLETRREQRAQHFTRGHASAEQAAYDDEPELKVEASVYDLVSALGEVLSEVPEPESLHEVERVQYTVEEQQEYVLERIATGEAVSFRALTAQRSKPFIIATFLAILELARQKYLAISLAGDAANFSVKRRALSSEQGAAPTLTRLEDSPTA